MGFGSAGYLPTNFWSRFLSSGAHAAPLAGLAGVVLTAAAAATTARWQIAAAESCQHPVATGCQRPRRPEHS